MSVGQNSSSQWKTWRLAVAAILVASQIAALAMGSSQQTAASLVMLASIGGVCIAAALLCWRSARSFDKGQDARRVWMLIMLMPIADLIVQIGYSLPGLLGNRESEQLTLPIANASSSLSRILAAAAFFMMFRVYKKTGLRLNLRPVDYVAMVSVILIGIASIVLSDRVTGMIAGNDDSLRRMLLLTGVPLVVALIPCAVFGVMIWRYAAEMGGGLVAKAWRSILLYTVLWTVRIVYAGVLTFFITDSNSIRRLIVPLMLINWILLTAQYLIFLGASYQYEACTGAIEMEGEMSIMPS